MMVGPEFSTSSVAAKCEDTKRWWSWACHCRWEPLSEKRCQINKRSKLGPSLLLSSWARSLRSYLMKLSVRVTQPKLGTDPVHLGIIRRPYRVFMVRILMELDCYRHQVSVAFDIKQAQACAHVPPFQVLSVLSIVRNVFQDLIIHHVNTAILYIPNKSLLLSSAVHSQHVHLYFTLDSRELLPTGRRNFASAQEDSSRPALLFSPVCYRVAFSYIKHPRIVIP